METQQSELNETLTQEDSLSLDQDNSKTENLSTVTPDSNSSYQLQQIAETTLGVLDKLPEYVGSFIEKNQQALLSVVFIISALITVKILIAILAAVNGIPLLAPIFELIGLFYSAWFGFRYLLKTETRQELSVRVSTFKQQLLG